MKKQGLINSISLIIKIYTLSIVVFAIFRFILFLSEIDRISFSQDNFVNIIRAFLMGIRFDVVVCGYIMIIPAVVLLLEGIFHKYNRMLNTIIFYWIFILFDAGFFISASDIPYFNHFFRRFDIGAFAWIDNPLFVLKRTNGFAAIITKK
jgi:hypothetical protein